jgi:hypothetical protein
VLRTAVLRTVDGDCRGHARFQHLDSTE